MIGMSGQFFMLSEPGDNTVIMDEPGIADLAY